MTHLHGGHATSLDMTEGAIWPILLQFTVPLLMGNLFQLLYNTVDSMVVGFGYPVGWILCAAAITIYYRFSHWEKA